MKLREERHICGYCGKKRYSSFMISSSHKPSKSQVATSWFCLKPVNCLNLYIKGRIQQCEQQLLFYKNCLS